MTALKKVRVHIVRPHRPECAARAKANHWATPWWLDGSTEWRSESGRGHRHGRTLWLVARCIFGDYHGKKFKGACKAMGVVHAMDLGDALTNSRQLSTTPRISKGRTSRVRMMGQPHAE